MTSCHINAKRLANVSATKMMGIKIRTKQHFYNCSFPIVNEKVYGAHKTAHDIECGFSLQGRTACMQISGWGFRCSSFGFYVSWRSTITFRGRIVTRMLQLDHVTVRTLMRPNGGRPIRCVLPPCQGIDYHAILIYRTMLQCLQRTLRILHGFYPLDHANILNLIT